MIKNCIICNEEIQEAWLNNGAGSFLIEQKSKGLKSKLSGVLVYVCPNCGHIEFVAEKPELFKK